MSRISGKMYAKKIRWGQSWWWAINCEIQNINYISIKNYIIYKKNFISAASYTNHHSSLQFFLEALA